MKKLGIILGIIAGVLAAGGGVAYASDSANPGDLLYPVDLAVENIQRVIIFDPISQTEFEAEVLSERVEELEVISEDGELDDIENLVVVIGEQGDRVREVEKSMNEECTGDNCDEGEKERVVNMVMEQNQNHTQTMNKVQNQVETKYGEQECAGACGKIIEVVEDMEEDVVIDEDVQESGGGNGSGSGGNGNN